MIYFSVWLRVYFMKNCVHLEFIMGQLGVYFEFTLGLLFESSLNIEMLSRHVFFNLLCYCLKQPTMFIPNTRVKSASDVFFRTVSNVPKLVVKWFCNVSYRVIHISIQITKSRMISTFFLTNDDTFNLLPSTRCVFISSC